jgi:TetR/AcrR family tetracycline transcriptional repressor
MLLRKADVVDGALRLLDAEGLDGITMRKLGASLNVRAGALYRHFPSKQALLDAMAEKLLEGVNEPLADAPWRVQLQVIAGRLRGALLTHRDGARVVAGAYVAEPNTLGTGQLSVEVLCDAGLTAGQAGRLTFALFYYILGHTIEEQALVELPPDDSWRERVTRSDMGLSPRFAEALDSTMSADPAERFGYGLEVFLDGIASQLPATRRQRGPRRQRAAGRDPTTAPASR